MVGDLRLRFFKKGNPSLKKRRSERTNPLESSTGAEKSKVISLAGPW